MSVNEIRLEQLNVRIQVAETSEGTTVTVFRDERPGEVEILFSNKDRGIGVNVLGGDEVEIESMFLDWDDLTSEPETGPDPDCPYCSGDGWMLTYLGRMDCSCLDRHEQDGD